MNYQSNFTGKQIDDKIRSVGYRTILSNLPLTDACPMNGKRFGLTEQQITIPTYNYDVYGSVIDNDGVVSNFVSFQSDYVSIGKEFSPNKQPWELVIDFTMGSDLSSNQGVYGELLEDVVAFHFSNGEFKGYITSSGGTVWNIENGVSLFAPSANTAYTIKLEYTGTEYNWYKYENDSWTLLHTTTDSREIADGYVPMFGSNRAFSDPFKGSINMNGCYININNELWWSGVTNTTETIYAKPDFVNDMADLYQDNPPTPATFVQPTLSSNGTLGGNDFAVWANTEFVDGNYSIWKAFDNDANTSWATNGNPNPSTVIFYNPMAINVTLLTMTNRGNDENITGGTVYGSNDNSNWTSLTTFTNTKTGAFETWTINLSGNVEYYKYYKIECTSFSGGNAGFTQIDITARTADYESNIFASEADWQTDVTNSGVCGKFVYDSENNTVRIPKYANKLIAGTQQYNAYYYLEI